MAFELPSLIQRLVLRDDYSRKAAQVMRTARGAQEAVEDLGDAAEGTGRDAKRASSGIDDLSRAQDRQARSASGSAAASERLAANLSEAERQARTLGQALKGISASKSTTVTLQAEEARAKIAEIQQRLRDIPRGVSVSVDTDTAIAESKLDNLDRKLARLGPGNVQVDVDTAGAVAQLAAFDATARALTSSLSGGGGGGGLKGLFADAGGAAGGFQAQLGRVAKGLALVAAAWSVLKLPLIIEGISAAVGVVGQLASGVTALTSSLGPLSALLPALGAGGLALAQAFIVGKLASGGLGDAIKKGAEAMNGGKEEIAKYNEQLEALTPAQQAFTGEVLSTFGVLKNLGAEIQKIALPSLGRSLEYIRPLFEAIRPAIHHTAREMGELAERASRFMGRGPFSTRMARIIGGNVPIIHELGGALLNSVDGATRLVLAVQPLTLWLSKLTEQGTRWVNAQIKAAEESGRLESFFIRARGSISQVGALLWSTAGAFGGLFKAAKPTGDWILSNLSAQAGKLSDLVNSVDAQRGLRTFFDNSRPFLEELGRLVVDIGKGMGGIFREVGPQLTPVIRQIREDLLPAILRIFSSLDVSFMRSFVSMATSLANFVNTFSTATPGLKMIVDLVAQLANAAVGAIDALGPFGDLLIQILAIASAASLFKGLFLVATGLRNIILAASGAQTLGVLPGIFKNLSTEVGAATGKMAKLSAAIRGLAAPISIAVAFIGLDMAMNEVDRAKLATRELFEEAKQGLDLTTLKGLTEWNKRVREMGDEAVKTGSKLKWWESLPGLIFKGKNAEKERAQAIAESNRAMESQRLNLGSVASLTRTSTAEVEKLANSLGLDLTRGYEQSTPAREQLIRHITELARNAYGSADAMGELARRGVDETTRLSQGVEDAKERTAKAFEGIRGIVSGFAAAPPEVGLGAFLQKTLDDVNRFMDLLPQAAAMKLDPTIIQQALEAGPTEAAKFLEQIVGDHSGRLVGLANETAQKLSQISVEAVEMARVTQQAINASSQQVAAEYPMALEILRAKAANLGPDTAEAIASSLRTTPEIIRDFTERWKIVLDESPVPEAGRQVGERTGSGMVSAWRRWIPESFRVGQAHTAAVQQGTAPMAPAAQQTGEQTGSNLAGGLGSKEGEVRGNASALDAAINQTFIPSMPNTGHQAGAGAGEGVKLELGARLGDVLGLAAQYAANLAKGLKPILDAIGSPLAAGMDTVANAVASFASGVVAQRAKGGTLPKSSEVRKGSGGGLVQWAEAVTGNEAHLFIPEKGASEETRRIYAQFGPKLGFDVVPRQFAVGGQVGASVFGGPGDPGTGHIGYRGDDLRGTRAFAELSNPGTLDFAALGGLPYRTALDITYNGKTLQGVKLDVGKGGGPVNGVPRKIDLWWELARDLGLNGLGVVGLNGAPGGAVGSGRGGFQTGAEVPSPPDLRGFGPMLGGVTSEALRKTYEDTVKFVNQHPPFIEALAGPVGPPSGQVGGTYHSILDYLRGKGINPIVTSTFRPGDPGFHGKNKAVDMAGPMSRIFNVLGPENGNPVPGINELFYDPMGYFYDEGKRRPGAIGGHMDHVHAAVFALGGLLKKLRRFATGGRYSAHDRPWQPGDPPVDSPAWNDMMDPNRGKSGYVQAEDGSWVPTSFYSRTSYSKPTAEDSPQFDWRVDGDRRRGVYVDEKYYLEHADGSMTPQAAGYPGGDPAKNRAKWTQVLPGVWIPPMTKPYPGVRGYASGGIFNAGVMDQGGTLMPGPNFSMNLTGAPESLVPRSPSNGPDATAAVERAVYNAIRDAIGELELSGDISVPLELDGKKMAEAQVTAGVSAKRRHDRTYA